MKVRFLKAHLENKAGDEVDLHEDRANYFMLHGVAEKVELQPTKEKKEFTPTQEKAKK